MFLSDLLIVFLVAGIAVYFFQLLRVPTVVGLLVAGVVVGPHGLSLVQEDERVRLLAEVGVIMLLFTVGLEFSLSRLISMGRFMTRIGLPQVAVCLAGTVAATWWHFGRLNEALFAGMLVAMSSTAIVLKILADRGELGSLHGRINMAVLLLQDLLVVVFMLVLPMLAPPGGSAHAAASQAPASSAWRSLALGVVVVAGVLAAGKYLVPRMLYAIVRTRNRELFLIAIFVICVGTAALTAWVGLSLALGAFLAGLALAESEYGHQTLAEVLPFRDTLSSLFFVSVGMLLDVRFMADHAPVILLSVLGLVVLKFISVALPTLFTGHSLRTAVLAALATAQIGEFSFVLATGGLKYHLLDASDYQTFIAAAVLTMGLTPFLITGGPAVVDWLCRWPNLARRLDDRQLDQQLARTEFRDHVVIAGYGFNGRNLAAALRELQIPYVVLETNPQTVRIHRQLGESILFGDCTRPAVLQHADIHRARAYVVGISDPVSTRRTVQVARQLNSQVHILVRTRYHAEVEDLRILGADEIIPEEFETSVEIFARVLREYQVPGNVINQLIARIRADHYEAFRGQHMARERLKLPEDVLGEAETETCLIEPGSAAIGRSIHQFALRTRTGASIVAVRREKQLVTNPSPDFVFQPGDVVVLLGDWQQIAAAMDLLTTSDRRD